MTFTERGELIELVRAGRVHVVCAPGAAAVAASALLLKALDRAGLRPAALTVIGYGERLEGPTARRWLADAQALLLVGLGTPAPLLPGVPQLAVEATAEESLVEHAFRLGQTLAPLDEFVWIAALGLIGGRAPHLLVARALGQTPYDLLHQAAELLDGAARAPEPAPTSLLALELLAAAPTARDFLARPEAAALHQAMAQVQSELDRALQVRPRVGRGVVVVEFDSPCRLEDLVATRQRGLPPGTAVLAANHGAIEGQVTVAARRAGAGPPTTGTLGRLEDEGTTQLDPATWAQLLARLGFSRPGAVGASLLPN